MGYRVDPPPVPLRGIVDRVSGSWESVGPFPPRRVLPDGGADLILSLDLESGESRAELFGPKSTALVVHNTRPLQKLAVHLRPGAYGTLFASPAHELRDRAVALEDLAPALARRLAKRVADERDWLARKRAVEQLLLEVLAPSARTCSTSALAREAVTRIHTAAGRAPVSALARELHTSVRTLERAFDLHVGLSPKHLARIARMWRAVAALERGERAADVAVSSGYSDQPHLVRELRALTGLSPARLERGV